VEPSRPSDASRVEKIIIAALWGLTNHLIVCNSTGVVDLTREKDIDLLRQAAILLEQENKRLVAKIIELTKLLMTARGEDKDALQLRLALLEQQLAAQRKKLFGDSSEKRPHDDNEPSKNNEPERPKPKGHGPSAQPNLPTIEVTHDLDEPDKVCPQCGLGLEEWPGQFEESEEIDVIERQFVIKKHKQKKYRCSCGGCIETAPGPEKLFPGARYSIDVAVDIGVQKYEDHAPLERQTRVFLREGLTVTSQTLWDYLDRSARLLEPAYDRLHVFVLVQPVLGADETWWRLMGKSSNGGGKRWHAWIASTASAIYICIQDSRSTAAAAALLPGYQGVVMCDGYGAYEALSRENPNLTLAHCWAHVRRKFFELETAFPAESKQMLDLIGELYAAEAACPPGPSGDELRHRIRGERSRAVIEAIGQWVYSTYPSVLPESGLARAIRYMGGMWRGLTRFLDDPRIPLDNNQTERAARGPVVGRKNHYGSRSRRGTEVAALFYSLVESAKLCGVEPKAYLGLALRAALRGEVIPLPHEIAAARKESFTMSRSPPT